MNSDHSTTGTTSTGKQIDYKGESETNGASMIKSKFVSGATTDHENMQSGWEKTYYDRYCMRKHIHIIQRVQVLLQGQMQQDYQIYYPFDDEGKSYTSGGEIRYIMNKNRTGASGGNRYIDEYMLHINLGCKKKKKEADISLIKDLYKMSVVVKWTRNSSKL